MSDLLPAGFFEAAGFVGVALYLGSYAALQFGLIRGSGYAYTLLNLAAATCILVSLVANFNRWSAIIQVSWIILSLYGLARFAMLTRRRRLTAQDRVLLGRWFPLISTPDAAQFMGAGEWIDIPPGTVIASEGEVIGALYFQVSGESEALLDDRTVGHIRGFGVIGELTCFTGEPAGATVRASSPVRAFRIGTPALVRLVKANSDLRLSLVEALGVETRGKLSEANARLGQREGPGAGPLADGPAPTP